MLPILHIEDNLIFTTSGATFGLYLVDPVPYAFQPKHTQQQVIDRVERGVRNLIGDFILLSLTKQLSPDQMIRTMRKRSGHRIWNEHQKDFRELLDQSLPFKRVNYIIAPLQSRFSLELRKDNIQDFLKAVWAGILDIRERIVYNGVALSKEQITAAKAKAFETQSRLNAFGRVRKAKLREIEWYLKKHFYRGISDPKLVLPDPMPVQVETIGKEDWIRPHKNMYVTLTDCYPTEKMYSYNFEHGDGSISYQTFFTSIQVPSDIPPEDPTGYEWVYGLLENLPYPVDCAIHLRIEPHHKAKESLQKKRKTAEAQLKEWNQNEDDVPEELLDDMGTVDELGRKLRGRQPLLHTKIIFALGADSRDLLEERVRDFSDKAQSYHTVVRAPGDMKRMFTAFYPFTQDHPSTWETPMDPGILAAAVPFGSKELGDPDGAYLGYLSNGKFVLIDPTRPATSTELNTTNAILVIGTLGSGKSYLMKYLTSILLSWGAYCFYIDPKGDSDPMAELPDVDAIVLRFTPESETQVTPFRIGNTQDARAILNLLYNNLEHEIRNLVIAEAVDRVKSQATSWDMYSFMMVIDDIRKNNPDEDFRAHADIVYKTAVSLEKHEIGRKFFGRDQGEDQYDNRCIIAILRGLSIPEKNKEKREWTENERMTAAIVYAVASMGLRKLMRLPRHVPKVLPMDEAWILRKFEQGEMLLQEALRYSRSENLIPIVGSQNATDMLARGDGDDFTGLFAWKFMLHLESLTQVKAALEILGMGEEDAQSWLKDFSEFRNGRGLVRDPEGKIGVLQVEALPKSITHAFRSTPSK